LNLHHYIRSKTPFSQSAIQNTVDLLSQDSTIPFIARYRKELTGNLNEVDIELIANLYRSYEDLQKRKFTVLKALELQDVLTEELKQKIVKTSSLIALEDLYLPFRKKRKTKADVARKAGLEPLAEILLLQNEKHPEKKASEFIKGEINTREAAIARSQHIIAEWINENQSIRAGIRKLYTREAVFSAKIIKAETEKPGAQKYQQYFDWAEPLKKIPSHRFLAIFRAENEGYLKIKIEVDKEKALKIIFDDLIKPGNNRCASYLRESAVDSFKRLLKPSFTTEFLAEAKKKADEDAILVFAENLEQLLLSPPLGGKRILAIDPGFISGCKVVCLDEKGSLLHNENIYPHPPQKEGVMAGNKINTMVSAYEIEAIAIGNGTASRETEIFIKDNIVNKEVQVFMVNEAGASIYSASKVARDEFPDHDITVRGAVSIGRRLSDPLAELVKIDPKSIGVGQYQHEVDQNKLKSKLDLVVTSCVNRIGVNVNTASRELLAYVSGIGPSLAENLLDYRKAHGVLKSRQELLKIPRLGAKAYEQSAAFLRIKYALNPLDDSAVHPERYSVVKRMAGDLGIKVGELIGNKKAIEKLDKNKYLSEDLGIHTLNDILKELIKPGADERNSISTFEFDPSINKITDIKAGMKLPGIINNITNFGCFVDIGVKESGLIHISKLARGYVNDVSSVVRLNQQIIVTVLEVDEDKKRIQLSLID